MTGLYTKYTIINNETRELVENAFVLKPEKDIHAAYALRKYAEEVRSENPSLANDLAAWLARIEPAREPDKTRADIEALKANWTADSCWDIEDTEGFEAHRVELLEYHLAWEQGKYRELAKKYNATLEARLESLSSLTGMLQAELTTLETDHR
jgi:hypothetical protein